MFLMVRLHARQAVMAVTLPSDRRVHEAMWLQALLKERIRNESRFKERGREKEEMTGNTL